ncbi:MAG: molybdopterin oxidoreductase [Lachnospiraceae bacterium]|nr:molybdopterin oxidoreductase [Lachnospiraceae bacterium]
MPAFSLLDCGNMLVQYRSKRRLKLTAVYKCACRGCHGGCLFDLTVEDGKLIKAVPSKEGPLNRGRACVKGLSIIEQIYHPDRLRYPMKRAGKRGEGKWERISWDEAISLIAEKMNSLIDTYGPECISSLTGTGRHHLPYFTRLSNAIGTPNASSAGGLICLGPRTKAAFANSGLFGGVDYYGSVRPGGIMVWGANPAVSGADGELQWFIKDAVKEGIPILVVDPMPTELALKAKIWLQIRPGTDGALALCIINLLIREDLVDHDFIDNYTVGFEELKVRCADYSVDKVSAITGIPADQIIEAARWIGSTKPLGLEQGCAFEQSTNSMDTSRAIHMIPAITGNYDVPGGFVESMEIAPAGLPLPNELPQDKKDIALTEGHAYLIQDSIAHPWNVLEAARTGKPYKIRGMFINANNTLISLADAKHSRECLMELDFLVCMDHFMTPTAELADIVLPAAMWPEVDCVFAMPEFGDQVLLSQQKVIQTGECRTDEEFFIELCRKAGWNFGYHDQREMMEEQIKIMKERRPELAGYTLDDLRERGFIAPERTYYNYKKNGFRTPSGKYEFASCVMKRYGLDPLPSWHEPQGTFVNSPETGEEYPLILITGGRQQSYFLTAYRQIRPLRDREPYPLVFMNPETADKYGIKEGSWVWIENEKGRITQKAAFKSGMKKDVVSCQFGWWYPEAGAPGYGWDESNVNILTFLDGEHDGYMGSYRMRALQCRIYPNPDCIIEKRYEKWKADNKE